MLKIVINLSKNLLILINIIKKYKVVNKSVFSKKLKNLKNATMCKNLANFFKF